MKPNRCGHPDRRTIFTTCAPNAVIAPEPVRPGLSYAIRMVFPCSTCGRGSAFSVTLAPKPASPEQSFPQSNGLGARRFHLRACPFRASPAGPAKISATIRRSAFAQCWADAHNLASIWTLAADAVPVSRPAQPGQSACTPVHPQSTRNPHAEHLWLSGPYRSGNDR